MSMVEVKVPDIGDFKDVPIIELLVKVGDEVKAEDSLMTIESDKATVDIPSPVSGVLAELKVKVGDKVSEGALLALIEVGAGDAPKEVPLGDTAVAVTAAPAAAAPVAAPADTAAPAAPAAPSAAPPAAVPPAPPPPAAGADVDYRPGDAELIPTQPRVSMPTPADSLPGQAAHASPSVRAFARELGVDVAEVQGSGPKSRILQSDVQAYVKGIVSGAMTAEPVASSSGGGEGNQLNLLPWPKIDFAKFGEIEVRPLSRIKKISGANLSRNWAMIPHVTQFDEADITDLDAFRVAMNQENEKSGIKLTMLAFLIKACVSALKKFPEFNASLDGDNLVFKQYFHIGFAADTPSGLVVPVLRDADQKSVTDIAGEMGELAKKARDGKLGPAEMQGGCFSISSLGGIGGTAFTPIINAPEVAILGVSRTQTKPVWDGKAFVPRQMLPLSLSYDHRVVDGATAARFTGYLSRILADMRRVML